MHERAVVLSDYALGVEAATFAVLTLRRHPAGRLRNWVTAFFGATSVASLTGGTVHGFTPDEESTGHRILWPTTMLAIGAAALSGWAIGATLAFPPRAAKVIVTAGAAEYFAYAAVVTKRSHRFVVAIANYSAPTLFLGGVFLRRYRRSGDAPALSGLTGLGVSALAAGVQQSKLGLHRRWADHNVVYHALQCVSLYLFFQCFEGLISASHSGEVS